MNETKMPEGSAYWWINSKGYREGKIVRNGKWTHTREHRVIMERALGRLLESHELVHHRNGNRTDNRLENLEIMSWAKHNQIHISKKFIEAGKINLELGRRCGKNGGWNKGTTKWLEMACSVCGINFRRKAKSITQSLKRGRKIVCSISCRSKLIKHKNT